MHVVGRIHEAKLQVAAQSLQKYNSSVHLLIAPLVCRVCSSIDAGRRAIYGQVV